MSLDNITPNSLQLNGAQINLEIRPSGGKHLRPSSRANLYSPTVSRPGSALPSLLLYKQNEYDFKAITRRPLSADSPPPKGSNSSLRKCKMAAKFDLTEEDSTILQSSELLEDLITPPISTWKQSEYKKNEYNNVAPQAVKEDKSDNMEEDSSDRNLTTNLKSSAQFVITPGLKSKPPLPKKVNNEPSKSSFVSTMSNNSDSSSNSKSKLDTLEDILSRCVDFSKTTHEFYGEISDSNNVLSRRISDMNYHNVPEFLTNGKCLKDLAVEDLDDIEEEKIEADDVVEDWISNEVNTANLDVISSEKTTDNVLTSLKNQQDELNFDHIDSMFSNEYDKSINTERQQKTCNDQPSIEETKNKILKQKKLGTKQKTSMPKKSILVKTKPKVNSLYISNEYVKHQPLDEDIETQISKKSISQNNYLDFLNKIKEIESTSKTQLADIPEQDFNLDSKGNDSGSYADIVSILEELEKEDKKSQQNMETMKEIVASELPSTNLNNKYEYKSSPAKENEENLLEIRNSQHSANNFNEILSYLDSVDKSCVQSLNSAKRRCDIVSKVADYSITLDSLPRIEDLETRSIKDLSYFVIELSLRVKEKSSAIKILQNELSKLRDQIQNSSKRTENTIKEKLKNQKEEYEGVIARHQKFIDQLILDKRTLNERCEELVLEMKSLENRYISNMKAAEHKFQVELQKMKEIHVAGEKMRRERWIDNKTQKIKEMTVKGLAPELENITIKHQEELANLRAIHKKEIEDLELRAARKTQQQCETLREQLSAEREKALAHERDLLRERYDKLVESEEKGYQEQRKRLLAEHARRVEECEIRENAAIAERDRAIKKAQDEFDDKINALIRKQKSEIKVMQETLELEKEAWKNNLSKQNAQQLLEKENFVREQCKRERDREIEIAIERLEKEANETKTQIEEATENRIRRLKDKHEKELMDLEKSEENAKTKYTEIKSKMMEKEEAIVSLKVAIKHLEIELSQTKEISEKLTNERTKMKEIVESETKMQMDALKNEILTLKEDKERQMQQLYSRVKVAVSHKDEILSELSRENCALQEKCQFLENLLEQQRKEYLLNAK